MTTLCPDCALPLQVGDWPFGCRGTGSHRVTPQDAQLHVSEKTTVFRAPDGKYSIPPTPDHPMHPKMQRAGYTRETLDTISQVKGLAKHGLRLERLDYHKNSAAADRVYGVT